MIIVPFANARLKAESVKAIATTLYDIGSNTEKKPRTNLQYSYKNSSKEIKSASFAIAKNWKRNN